MDIICRTVEVFETLTKLPEAIKIKEDKIENIKSVISGDVIINLKRNLRNESLMVHNIKSITLKECNTILEIKVNGYKRVYIMFVSEDYKTIYCEG